MTVSSRVSQNNSEAFINEGGTSARAHPSDGSVPAEYQPLIKLGARIEGLKKGPVSDETNAEIKKLITKYKKILSRVAPVKYTAKNSLTNTLFVVPGEEIDLSVFPSVHKNPLDDDYLDMIIETTPPKAGPEVVVDPNPLDYFSGYDDYIADKNNRN